MKFKYDDSLDYGSINVPTLNVSEIIGPENILINSELEKSPSTEDCAYFVTFDKNTGEMVRYSCPALDIASEFNINVWDKTFKNNKALATNIENGSMPIELDDALRRFILVNMLRFARLGDNELRNFITSPTNSGTFVFIPRKIHTDTDYYHILTKKQTTLPIYHRELMGVCAYLYRNGELKSEKMIDVLDKLIMI